MEQVESHTRRLLGTLPSSEVKSTAFHFQPNDILYGRLRPYLNKVLLANFEGLCSSEFIVMPPSEVFEPKYLAFYLNNDDFVAFANSLNQGDRPRVSFEQIDEHEIPLPPLAEQRRIVAKLEGLLGKVDGCRKRLAKIPILLKRFRQSVLAAACSGRLTADWREENLSSPSERENDPEAVTGMPAEWSISRMEPLIHGLDQGWSPQCEGQPSPSADEWGVIKTTAVQALSFLEMENKKLPSILKPRPELELKSDDLLITRAGPRARAAVCCHVHLVRPRLMICDKVYRFRANEERALSRFLALALNTPAMVEHLDTLKTGISDSGVNLTQSKFRELKLSLPPLPEQHEIVRRVEALFALADQIEARYAKAKAHVDRLTQSILAKAFRGELVPQDPHDEPASALLERIREERSRSFSRAQRGGTAHNDRRKNASRGEAKKPATLRRS